MTTGRERGKKLFAELGAKVRQELNPSGEPLLHAKGQKAIADLAADLQGPDGPPGLKVFRDGVDRFRLQRPQRNGQISVSWVRSIGALVVHVEKGDRKDPEVRYVLNAADDAWHRMQGEGELYEDIAAWLGEILYPESKRT